MSTTALAMTRKEAEQLERCEDVIRRGLGTFIVVGEALRQIRDARLYRATHSTFDGYCRDRWDFRRARAYQLISAAQEARDLSEAEVPPKCETQIRPLLRLHKEERRSAWEESVKRAAKLGTPCPTQSLVRQTVDRRLGKRGGTGFSRSPFAKSMKQQIKRLGIKKFRELPRGEIACALREQADELENTDRR